MEKLATSNDGMRVSAAGIRLANAGSEMLAASAFPAPVTTAGLSDALGERFLRPGGPAGDLVQVLRLRAVFAESPGFELALRERVVRLTNLRNASYARALRVERLDAPAPGVALVSEHVEGVRLSELLRIARERKIEIDISTTISIVRQLVSNTAMLHEHAVDLTHGLIAPERLIVTPRGRIVIYDHALAGAVATLRYTPDRLWNELRVAVSPNGPIGRITRRDDVLAIGLVTLALVLGRPIEQTEFPQRLPMLLEAARERSAFGHDRPISAPLREWLSRALQLDSHASFSSAPEAWVAFEQMVAADPVYAGAPIALEMFVYSCTAALIEPADSHEPDAVPPPVRAEAAQGPRPAAVPAVAAQTLASAPRPEAVPVAIRSTPRPPAPRPVPPEAEIDWGAADTPAPTAMANDIAGLFAAVDGLPREESQAAAVARHEPDPPFEAEGLLSDAAPAPVPADVREALLPTPADWNLPPGRSAAPRWRLMAIAAAVVMLLAGGLTARLLLPSATDASEMATLTVDSSPAGLQVLLDGAEHGVTPARLSVTPGEHLLEVRGAGTARIVPLTLASGASISQHFEIVGGAQPAGSSAAAEPVAAPHAEAAVPMPSSGTSGSAAPAIRPAADAVHLSGTPASMHTTGGVEPAAQTWGWVAVKAPFPVDIRVGERVISSSGQRIRMAEGRHQIEIQSKAADYRDARVIHVVAGKVTDVTVDAVANGTLNINASPWAEVWIGQRRIGETPLANINVPAGQHEVVLRHPELGEKRQTVAVRAGSPARLSVDMR